MYPAIHFKTNIIGLSIIWGLNIVDKQQLIN